MPRKAQPHPYRPTSVRYTDPNGRRCSKATPGATAHAERSRVYVADVPRADGSGIDRKVSLGVPDLGAAWVRLRELLDERRRAAEGLADPLLAHARKPLSEHVEEWHAGLAASGCSQRYPGLVRRRVEILAGLAGWKRLADITEGSALAALAELDRQRLPSMRKGVRGRGEATRNHYVTALRQFVRWALAGGRLVRNPLPRLKRSPAVREPRQARRSPEDAEIGRLLAFLAGQGERKPRAVGGLSPEARGLLYRLAMASGLRAGELRSLARESFDLDRGTVTVRASHAKNRRAATVHLPGWLVAELREWFAAGGGCWGGPSAAAPGRALRIDLAGAQVPYAVSTPEGLAYFDFHSFRHWYITWAAHQPNISPKALLAMARHSDPRLTLQTYAHAQDRELAAHAGRMPDPGGPGRTDGRTESANRGVHCGTPEQWWAQRDGWPEG